MPRCYNGAISWLCEFVPILFITHLGSKGDVNSCKSEQCVADQIATVSQLYNAHPVCSHIHGPPKAHQQQF